jgi:hypothetical protein
MTRNQDQQQNHNATICNESLENVSECKYLGTTVINRDEVHDEIRRISSENTYYYSTQNLLYPIYFINAENS